MKDKVKTAVIDTRKVPVSKWPGRTLIVYTLLGPDREWKTIKETTVQCSNNICILKYSLNFLWKSQA